eukprot:TRINITY_DN538_c0_g1_i14.p3 TRINITY_DN538_c0_g1~~TRINITY_DN538_c0_g1_i14.p3  ORF type:complete len:103 (+),score=3.68 TRINITY_DN538_c0_g1_i14:708-1016(+)
MCRTFGPNIVLPEIQPLQRGVDPQRIRKMCRSFGPNIVLLFNALSEHTNTPHCTPFTCISMATPSVTCAHGWTPLIIKNQLKPGDRKQEHYSRAQRRQIDDR